MFAGDKIQDSIIDIGDRVSILEREVSLDAGGASGELNGPVHLQVKNTSGGALTKGSPVYATGSVGASGAVEVSPSDADATSTMPALGLLNQDLSDGQTGDATILGVIREVDTSAYAVNDELYVSTTAGALTNVRPASASALIQKIGRVVRSHATTGEIVVLGAGRTNDVPHPLYVDHTNQRVGIGTTSPTVTLDVRGGAIIDDDLTVNQTLDVDGSAEISPNLTVSNNVGIGGVTATAGHLHVASQNRAVTVLDSGTNNYAELGFTSQNSDGPAYGYLSGYGIFFRTGTTRGGLANRVYIEPGGDVGIGTTSPSEKLHVNGTVRVGDTGRINLVGTDTTYPNSFNMYNTNGSAYWHVSAPRQGDSNKFGLFWYTGTSWVTTLTVDTSGRLGIKDSSPSYELDVAGSIRATADIHANDEIYVGVNGGGDSPIHFYDDNSNTWRTLMWDDSANHFYFEGNIQINGTKLQDPGSANNLRVQTAHGYIDIGPQNTTYCHIYTDRAQFYLNKGINSAPFLYWRNNSGIGGPLQDTSTGTGYRYVFQNQTYGTFFDYTSVRARKEQIVNVTEADAGRWIDALQPVTYIERWMGEGEEPEDNKRFREADMQVGFIADDVLDNPETTHFSQVLDNGEGGFDPAGWKWECVLATAVAEIKSLRARVAALEA